MDHVLHLAMLTIGVAAFFIVPAAAAVPIFLVLTGVAVATVVEWQGRGGLVRHRGEIWRAEGPTAFGPRARVRIVAADGTLLQVWQDDAGPGRPRRPT